MYKTFATGNFSTGISRQLCKPSTSSRVCITVSNSPNPPRVYIRLCKHGKRFLLLNWHTDVHPKPLPLSTRYFGTGLPILKEDPHFKKKDLITLNITFIWHRGYMIVAYRYPLWVKWRVPSYTESQFNIWRRCSWKNKWRWGVQGEPCNQTSSVQYATSASRCSCVKTGATSKSKQ